MGILVMAADHTEITGNQIIGHKSHGVIVMSFLTSATGTGVDYEIDIEPNSDYTLVHGNVYENNGYDPALVYKANGIPGADLAWDETGEGNAWVEPAAVTRTPEKLPENPQIEHLRLPAPMNSI